MVEYKLFQVKNDLTRNYGFMGLSMMESLGIEVDLNNYDLVYEGKVETDAPNVLEELYRIFNIEHPEDFYGRSMSVSDIVQVGNDYFYCDSIGWENIEKNIKC
jgi:hypothetical protein